MKKILFLICLLASMHAHAQRLYVYRVPETNQSTHYAPGSGEDADYLINPMSYSVNSNGTVIDYTNMLMWQKVSVGDFTYDQARNYVSTLRLGGYSDWRLPNCRELMSINYFDHINPAFDTSIFSANLAEYWWTSDMLISDTSRVWLVNAGGGCGPHPRSESVAAGGSKHIYVRAVRSLIQTPTIQQRFLDQGNGSIMDQYTGLIWLKTIPSQTYTWEPALAYVKSLNVANANDWRLPNVKELQSLTDFGKVNPAINNTIFSQVPIGDLWSSTTLYNTPAKAWNLNTQYGIITQIDKSSEAYVIAVRGGNTNAYLNLKDVKIPTGTFEMGDHFGFVDPGHPSDETPIHTVTVDSFEMGQTEVSNAAFLTFLNEYWLMGRLDIRNNLVYLKGDTNILYYTNAAGSYYSIKFTGNGFAMADQRLLHPVSGINWYGCIAYCNWLSIKNMLDTCYNLKTGACDFTKNGYRLPTEAEWEWAARGGNINPYFNYCLGNSLDTTVANLPNSGDPFETGTMPLTTPCGFYDGNEKYKSDYYWPSSANTYKTSQGANGFGLYDMQGNVWELLNDWYSQDYYKISDVKNPKGPTTGFIMPDGKPYRGMRGGNWYNGLLVNGISDGHSRVSNRNPSYYRGPQDPNHPWYHIGFRVVKQQAGSTTGTTEVLNNSQPLFWPNPVTGLLHIAFESFLDNTVEIACFNTQGKLVYAELKVNEQGKFYVEINTDWFEPGLYLIRLKSATQVFTSRIIVNHN